MPLVEVILASRRRRRRSRKALDFVGQLKMVPIVVTDSRGFYTSRVFQTFIHEGMRMLEEGVQPALIENAAKMAGMPVGPLAVTDEVTIELPLMILGQTRRRARRRLSCRPAAPTSSSAWWRSSSGPANAPGIGFYDYPDGGKKRLWPGLNQAFPPAPVQPASRGSDASRLLFIQALETARCLEEGVSHAGQGGRCGLGSRAGASPPGPGARCR